MKYRLIILSLMTTQGFAAAQEAVSVGCCGLWCSAKVGVAPAGMPLPELTKDLHTPTKAPLTVTTTYALATWGKPHSRDSDPKGGYSASPGRKSSGSNPASREISPIGTEEPPMQLPMGHLTEEGGKGVYESYLNLIIALEHKNIITKPTVREWLSAQLQWVTPEDQVILASALAWEFRSLKTETLPKSDMVETVPTVEQYRDPFVDFFLDLGQARIIPNGGLVSFIESQVNALKFTVDEKTTLIESIIQELDRRSSPKVRNHAIPKISR